MAPFNGLSSGIIAGGEGQYGSLEDPQDWKPIQYREARIPEK